MNISLYKNGLLDSSIIGIEKIPSYTNNNYFM